MFCFKINDSTVLYIVNILYEHYILLIQNDRLLDKTQVHINHEGHVKYNGFQNTTHMMKKNMHSLF